MSNGFASLGIREQLVQSLQESGVVEPTPIQKKAIPELMSGIDVIAQAQTGTGKTLAFVLPMLELIDVKQDHVQALILTPTRELAIQISSELNKLAPIVGAKVLAAYGGQDVERQLKKLQKSIHIVVGTPGRLLDHLRRGSVEFYKLNMLVLDEADQMLHMGFFKEVEEIIAQTSPRRQTLLFSATMPQQVSNLAKRYMREPKEIHIQAKQVTLEGIEQVLIQVSDREKQDALIRSIESYKPYLAMIFCRTKRRASALNEALQEIGYASDELHGDLSQAKREQVMKRFRDAKIELLVATDVAARGLDVEGVTHVFNYDIPQDAESYIHRIGRTGRAGQTGVAVTFASPRDMVYLEQIENGIRMNLRRPGAPLRRERNEEGSFASETGRKRQGASRQGEGAGKRTAGERGGRASARGAAAGKRGAGAGGERIARGARGTNAGVGGERGTRGANAGAGSERGARGSNVSAASERIARGANASEGRVRGGYSPYANEVRERSPASASAGGERGARGASASAGGERGARGASAGASGERGARGGYAGTGGERGARGASAGAGGERGARGGYAGAGGERGARGGYAGAGGERGTRGARPGAGADRRSQSGKRDGSNRSGGKGKR